MMGYSYLSKNDFTNAIDYFQRYADVAPNEANPYDSMGEVYLEMNEYEKSIEMYQKALKIKPDYKSAYRGLASNYIKTGNYQGARNYLNQWSKIAHSFPNRNQIHLLLATSYIAEGDIENTLKEYENRVNLSIQKRNTFQLIHNHFTISQILYENGKMKEAEERLAMGKELIDNSALTEVRKSRLWRNYLAHSILIAIKKGEINQAKKYTEKYREEAEKTEDPMLIKNTYSFYGIISYTEDNYEKAISDLKQSDPNNPYTIYYLALAYIKIGDEEKAIEKLESIVNYPGFVTLIDEMLCSRAEKQLARLKTSE
jgi:tetratricopeptide (TPR) repeat protein